MISAAKFPDSASLVKVSDWSLYDGTPASSPLTILTPPTGSFRCKATISSVSGHTDITGTLTIGGETQTFTQAGTKSFTTTLTAKPVVTYSSLDCHIHVTAIDTSGNDIVAESLTTIDINFTDETEYYNTIWGIWTKRPAQAMTEDTTSVVGDVIRFNSINYPIKAIHPKDDKLAIERFRILQF
jgi:hypothetical protein